MIPLSPLGAGVSSTWRDIRLPHLVGANDLCHRRVAIRQWRDRLVRCTGEVQFSACSTDRILVMLAREMLFPPSMVA